MFSTLHIRYIEAAQPKQSTPLLDMQFLFFLFGSQMQHIVPLSATGMWEQIKT